MKILFVSPTLPHAQVISGSIIVHNRIKLLAQRGYEVALACFMGPGDETYVPDLKPMMRQMEFVQRPRRPGRVRRFVDYFAGLPAPFSDVESDAMQRLVGFMVERYHYDVVLAEFAVMGQFLYRNPYLPATRRIISCHSCLTMAFQKAMDLQRHSLQAWRKRLVLKRLQEFEFGAYRNADLTLALTSQERLDLLKYEPNLRIAVIPYGVDVEHYQPRPQQDSEESLVFTGYYSDEPNRDAVMWFAHTVWPGLRARHPNLRFYVIGRNPTSDIRELSRKDPRIEITGEVADVAPYLARARIYICPMRMGTGFRGKILQAMASGVPVVSTTLAAEGISAENGSNIILADTPHVMAESIDMLLADADLRRAVARNARDMVVKRFSWQHCVDKLEDVLREIVR